MEVSPLSFCWEGQRAFYFGNFRFFKKKGEEVVI